MTGRIPHRQRDGKWEYTLAAAAREEARFEVMEEYIKIRHNTVLQFIDTQSLLDLFGETDRAPGERVGMQWWEKAVIDLAGARY